ncbi:MAG: hypothetical protein SVV03_01055 [Candidatus Nanohaloarchaea archaeon]|nr:hypothetical protein [Candidatus Nanohaloarchaea archaeon]
MRTDRGNRYIFSLIFLSFLLGIGLVLEANLGILGLGLNTYDMTLYSGVAFAIAMIFMMVSCYSFRHFFDRAAKCPCGKRGKKVIKGIKGAELWLNENHRYFFWLTVAFFLIHIPSAIAYVGGVIYTAAPLTSLLNVRLIMGWILLGAFLLWGGTCYYFRFVTEKKLFRHPPRCALEGGAGRQIGTGEKNIYKYHRHFLILTALLLPLHPSLVLTGSLTPGLAVIGVILLYMIYIAFKPPA